MGVLTTATDAKARNLANNVAYVRDKGGVSAMRQVLQTLALRLFLPGGFSVYDYYVNGMWRPGFDRARRRTYLSKSRNLAYNNRLRVPALGEMDDVIVDKLASDALFREAGFDVPTTKAAFGSQDVPDGIEVLADAEALRAFFRRPGTLPVFCKQRAGSLGGGAAMFEAISDDGNTVTLGNGIDVPLEMIVGELVAGAEGDAQANGGFIFQEVLRNAPELRTHVGAALGTMRMVTVLTEAGPELFYAVQKLPSITAMHDKVSVNRRADARIDPATGTVRALSVRARPLETGLTHWHDPDTPVVGLALPGWEQAVQMVRDAHLLFPAHGVLGWDIALSDRGPVIVEVNANPHHFTFQDPQTGGVLGPPYGDIYARALARQKAAGQ